MDLIATNYYSIHATKLAYDHAFDEARQWVLNDQEGTIEGPTTAARIYHVKEEALRKSVQRARRKVRNSRGLYNQHGGDNYILTPSMEQAIEQYCFEKWQNGLGVTPAMLKAAIIHLRACPSPPQKPPSDSWFHKWLRNNPNLHTVKTKPIAYSRLESYAEADRKANITKLKNILIMDESGVRVGCPGSEKIIVPTSVREVYTTSPENRKSV